MKYYLNVLKNYAVFSGRARRKEYWMFVLFNIIFAVITAVLDNILGTTFEMHTAYGSQGLPYGYINLLYNLIVLIPGIAVSVRRLHDVGKSGWFLLIALIPLIGFIWLLVLFCTEGTPGANKYGEDPKAAERTLLIP